MKFDGSLMPIPTTIFLIIGLATFARARIAAPVPTPTKSRSSDRLTEGWTPIPTEPPDLRARMDIDAIQRGGDNTGDEEWGVEPSMGDFHPEDTFVGSANFLPSQDKVGIELARRADNSTDEWINDSTCGWKTDSPSKAWTCSESSTCLTASGVVGCKTGTRLHLITTCLGYTDYLDGKCNVLTSMTGCCSKSKYPYCGTYYWSDHPGLSMLRCFPSSTEISLLDSPKFLVDAAAFSATATLGVETTAPTETLDAATTTEETSEAGADEDDEDLTTTIVSAPVPNDSTSDGDESSNSNTGPIIGGVIAGFVGLGLLAVGIFWYYKKRQGQSKNGLQHDGRFHHELVADPLALQPSPKWPGPDGRLLTGHYASTDQMKMANEMMGNSGISDGYFGGPLLVTPFNQDTIIGGELEGTSLRPQHGAPKAELP